MSRTLLTSRLRELERLGLVSRDHDRDSRYALTAAGESLRPVIQSLGVWGERWLEIAPEHADPGYVLNSWCNRSLATENLPQERVVARFDFTDQPKASTPLWMVFNGTATEVCRHFPGYDEDLIVTAESVALTEWHLGRIEWRDALATGRIEVSGAPKLARALPSWNRRSSWTDADHYPAPGVSTSQTRTG